MLAIVISFSAYSYIFNVYKSFHYISNAQIKTVCHTKCNLIQHNLRENEDMPTIKSECKIPEIPVSAVTFYTNRALKNPS